MVKLNKEKKKICPPCHAAAAYLASVWHCVACHTLRRILLKDTFMSCWQIQKCFFLVWESYSQIKSCSFVFVAFREFCKNQTDSCWKRLSFVGFDAFEMINGKIGRQKSNQLQSKKGKIVFSFEEKNKHGGQHGGDFVVLTHSSWESACVCVSALSAVKGCVLWVWWCWW